MQKMDNITIDMISENDSVAMAEVNTEWITPLEKLTLKDFVKTVNRNGKWYILKGDVDLDLPPDQLMSNNVPTYYNHGRRRINN